MGREAGFRPSQPRKSANHRSHRKPRGPRGCNTLWRATAGRMVVVGGAVHGTASHLLFNTQCASCGFQTQGQRSRRTQIDRHASQDASRAAHPMAAGRLASPRTNGTPVPDALPIPEPGPWPVPSPEWHFPRCGNPGRSAVHTTVPGSPQIPNPTHAGPDVIEGCLCV